MEKARTYFRISMFILGFVAVQSHNNDGSDEIMGLFIFKTLPFSALPFCTSEVPPTAALSVNMVLCLVELGGGRLWVSGPGQAVQQHVSEARGQDLFLFFPFFPFFPPNKNILYSLYNTIFF